MSMCRLNRVDKARKAQGKCGKCGQPINVGDAYRWWKGRYTGRYVRCAKPSCTSQPWELETNSLRAEAMQAESLVSDCQGSEDAGTAAEYLREAISLAESVRDQLDERVSNWQGTNLEYSSQAEATGYTKDAYDDWLSTAEGVAEALEALEPDAPNESDFDADDPEYANADDPEDAASEAYDQACQAYADELEQALSELEELPELDLGA